MVGCGEGGALIEAFQTPAAYDPQAFTPGRQPRFLGRLSRVGGGRLANKLQDLLISPEISKTARAVGTSGRTFLGAIKVHAKSFNV